MKFKLGIILTVIMIILVGGIVVILLQQFSNVSLGLNFESLRHLANGRAAYWKSREDAYMQVLRTLANIMGSYEDLPAQERRVTYNGMLEATLEAQADLVALYTVWKPDAIDGMDAQHIGWPGSSPSGQYAMAYIRESGWVRGQTSADIEDAMAYLNSPNTRWERVDSPVPGKTDGRDTFTYTMMVPIINRTTNEVVGGVGCILAIDPIQQRVEETLKTYWEIDALTVFADNGLIMGHIVPDRIGKMMEDTETIFGDYLNEAVYAVREGREFQCSSYSPVLMSNVEIIIVPFTIGNSHTAWSLMLAVTEDYMLAELRSITRFTVMLAIMAMLVTATIIFVVLNAMLPSKKAGK